VTGRVVDLILCTEADGREVDVTVTVEVTGGAEIPIG
jgi:hypothetical protein